MQGPAVCFDFTARTRDTCLDGTRGVRMQETSLPGRLRQIDGLRAATMFAVLYVHLFRAGPATEHLRVSMFFALSGFLITHILISAGGREGSIRVLNFYARRALRLLPALAILCLVAALFNMDGFRASAPWHVFQLSNIYFGLNETQRPWVMGHLWSLNVLEQFYLLMPLTVLFLPRPLLFVFLTAVWILAAFLRVNAEHLGLTKWLIEIVLPVDPIAAGALTALLVRDPRIAAVLASPAMMLVSLAVVASPAYLWDGYGGSESYRLLMQPAICALVAGAYFGYRGPVGWVLASGPAAFAAKISYGVYIYHAAVWWFLGEKVDPAYYDPGLQTFLVVGGLSLLIAVLSWYAIEEPISRAKRFFPTHAKPAASATPDTLSAPHTVS